MHAPHAVFNQISDLDGVSFRGANLRQAKFTQASLKNADLREADLTRAVIFQSTLTGANITGATIAGTDWTQSSVSHVTTGDHLIGHFPLDAVVLTFFLAIAVFVLHSSLRMQAGRLPAIAVLAIISGALVWQVAAAATGLETMRLFPLVTLVGPLLFICCFVGGFVWIAHANAAPGWRSALSLLTLLAGLYILLTTLAAVLQQPTINGEAFQQACTAATCLGGHARGFRGMWLGGLLTLLGLILFGKTPQAAQ